MLSIITPTHKKGRFWDLTVESVMQQTCLDFEWVILDNSREGYFTTEFERFKQEHPEYEAAYPNVKIYHEVYEMPHTVAFYKNRCVELCTCGPYEYVLVLDHDDFMTRTTVEDILGCAEKYGEQIQYITGFGAMLNVKGEGFVPVTDYNGDLTRKRTGQDITIGKNFKLALSHVEISQITRIDWGEIDFLLGSHPRAIKRMWLDHKLFRFYEGSRLEEDTMQVMFAPIFMNCGWIDRYSVIYIGYAEDKTNINSSFVKTKQDYLEHVKIDRAKTMIYEGLRKLYGPDSARQLYPFNEFKTKDEPMVESKVILSNQAKPQPVEAKGSNYTPPKKKRKK